MDRRTENHSPTRSFSRSATFASSLLVASLLLAQAGGCQAVRERRAQRAADRQAAKEAKASQVESQDQLPNAQPIVVENETQSEWMQRQQAARRANEQKHDAAENGRMVVVDDRPSAQSQNQANRSDEPQVEIVDSRSKKSKKLSKVEASYARAVELHASGDLEASLRELERAIAFNPKFTLAYLEAGDIYLEMSQYDLAEREYAKAVRAEPRNFMAQYRHAQVLHRLGELQAANRAYLRALSIRPSDFDANLGISIVLLELGKAEQALPYGQRAVRSDPPSGRARMHLGNVYAAIDQHEKAVIEYQQAAELMDAPTPGLLLNMAESLNQLGRYAEMVGALDQLVRMEPNAIAYERLGSGLFRLKRYDESLAAFRKATDYDHEYYPAFNGIAVCELNQYLWSSKTDGQARQRAVDAMRKSLRLERKQPRIVELLRRYSQPSSTEK